MTQILNHLKTLHMARPCRNLHQSTLTKGRKKPSSLNPPSFLAWLPTWKHHRGSAYHCEAIWLLSMRGQQPYPLLNSPWSSWGACLPLLGCLRPGSKQGGERPANTIATGQRWGKSHSKNRTQGHVPWQSAEDTFWKPPSQQLLWWLIRVGDGLSMARRGLQQGQQPPQLSPQRKQTGTTLVLCTPQAAGWPFRLPPWWIQCGHLEGGQKRCSLLCTAAPASPRSKEQQHFALCFQGVLWFICTESGIPGLFPHTEN